MKFIIFSFYITTDEEQKTDIFGYYKQITSVFEINPVRRLFCTKKQRLLKIVLMDTEASVALGHQ